MGVAGVSDFFSFFSNESKSKKNRFLFEGVKVREDWLVLVCLKKNSNLFSLFFCGGGIEKRQGG